MPQITVPLTDQENLALHKLAFEQDISPEKVMILALRLYQLQAYRVNALLENLGPVGCGPIE